MSQDAIEIDGMSVAMNGEKLSDVERNELEDLVKTKPDDQHARFQLVGYYFGKQSPRRLPHVLWVIKNYPTSNLAGSPLCYFFKTTDAEAYGEGARLWQAHIAAQTVLPEVLLHASSYLDLADSVAADLVLRRGLNEYPKDARFPTSLAHALTRRRPAKSAEAFAMFEKALALSSDENERFALLGYVAKSAVQAGDLIKAKSYATELLTFAERINDWNTGNAVHHGNLVLGRVALKENNVELACVHLLKAGATKGSPQLDSFGPNMVLAKELLEHGRRETVLAYFDLCATFWKDSRLAEWKRQVELGATPDFGGNLLY